MKLLRCHKTMHCFLNLTQKIRTILKSFFNHTCIKIFLVSPNMVTFIKILFSILINKNKITSVCVFVCLSVRHHFCARGVTAGGLIWYWHEAQCPADVLVRVSFRLVASGPSYGRFKGRRSKNGQKWP